MVLVRLFPGSIAFKTQKLKVRFARLTTLTIQQFQEIVSHLRLETICDIKSG